jgi:hypothetical protein
VCCTACSPQPGAMQSPALHCTAGPRSHLLLPVCPYLPPPAPALPPIVPMFHSALSPGRRGPRPRLKTAGKMFMTCGEDAGMMLCTVLFPPPGRQQLVEWPRPPSLGVFVLSSHLVSREQGLPVGVLRQSGQDNISAGRRSPPEAAHSTTQHTTRYGRSTAECGEVHLSVPAPWALPASQAAPHN